MPALTGRDFLAIPGPSVMPDRVLNAMHRPAPNIYGRDLMDMTDSIFTDLRRLARTDGTPVIYVGNGHAVWEASLANMMRPGDRFLVVSTGEFAHGWARTAETMQYNPEILEFGFRAPFDPQVLEDRLRRDRDGSLRAVLIVHTDTASSVRNNIARVREAMDAAGHPALLMVDCVASLGCEQFETEKWGVDVVLAACQKGLMTPPGLAFTFHGKRAENERISCTSPYWDWGARIDPEVFYHCFCGTPPSHHLFGLREALDMILHEEGLEAVWARHERIARAIWAAGEVWSAQGGLELNISDPGDRSTAVTTFRTAPGDGDRIRNWCDSRSVTLGIGFVGKDQNGGDFFRIGHMGHVNMPTILGVLATIEAALVALNIPHNPGGVEAAIAVSAAG